LRNRKATNESSGNCESHRLIVSAVAIHSFKSERDRYALDQGEVKHTWIVSKWRVNKLTDKKGEYAGKSWLIQMEGNPTTILKGRGNECAA
jgi:hypothetical protein